jgi:hypothetical protein
MQMLFAQIYLKCVRGRALPWKYAPLELVRTAVLFLCWLGACSTRRIAWRGHPFVIGADSAITPIAGSEVTPPSARAARGATGRARRLRAT